MKSKRCETVSIKAVKSIIMVVVKRNLKMTPVQYRDHF
ncbi:hypothetical protein BSM4216_0783 [Bacillus smithii]|nr:hypothetical protein BSM4216_0783 [Bacillus smithii]